MSFTPGALVRARNREWIVLPESNEDLVMVRPLGGTDDEVTGILTALESVEAASFAMPTVDDLGDYRSARLLRDALRLGFRSGAGPFRSLAKIAVEPRPYQLVPLLMALKLDPVRILIADDVGIGKTIEASLIAREMMEEGRASRLCVLCPPHLAEQWQSELAEKFHIEAELVLASTASRLERSLPPGTSIFDRYPNTIVSIDFIKSDRRRDDFIRACPDLVIVDEAHTCADPGEGSGSRHQRYQLVADLADREQRHMILVTATPHSGKPGAFRSLLSLVDDSFGSMPDSLAGDENRALREQLARHLVQRRRHDVREFDLQLGTENRFPSRREAEQTYGLSTQYREVFNEVLDFARETVRTAEGPRQRVRWWSALGLLRALASSPAAAAATMRTRAATADASTTEAVDEIGRQIILDLDEPEEGMDVVPGSHTEDTDSAAGRRLRDIAERTDRLEGPEHDAKLAGVIKLTKDLLKQGHHPIVFCRFIETAEYVAKHLRDASLGRGVEIEAVTGRIPPSDREDRIARLGAFERRVLVATDCLSEGINLQDHFSAVLHYDLPWNPTRLEQREGRVDRFGQIADEIGIVTYFGADNQIDQIVQDVLIRKHVEIRKSLGISIPVPGSTNDVIEALAERLFMSDAGIEDRLPGFEEFFAPVAQQLELEWDGAAEQARQRSRSIFAQNTIDPSEVSQELADLRSAIGSADSVEEFVRTAVVGHRGVISNDVSPTLDLSETSDAFRDAVGVRSTPAWLKVRFDPSGGDAEYLSRTHPFVAGLAGHILDEALDSKIHGIAARGGVICTSGVAAKTTLILARIRMTLTAERTDAVPMVAEEAALLGWSGAVSQPNWLSDSEVDRLFQLRPTDELPVSGDKAYWLGEALDEVAALDHELERIAAARAAALVQSHERVRSSAGSRGGQLARHRAEPQLPVDVLGVYVFLPEVTL